MKKNKIIVFFAIAVFSFVFLGYGLFLILEKQTQLISNLESENDQLGQSLDIIKKKIEALAKPNPVFVDTVSDTEKDNQEEWKQVLNIVTDRQKVLEEQVNVILKKYENLELALQTVELDSNTNDVISNTTEALVQPNQIEEVDVAAQLSNTFQLQSEDTAWSASTLHVLEQTLNAHSDKVQLQQAECRSSMCRIEMAFNNTETGEQDFGTLMHEIPGKGERFFEIKEDGTAIVYIARDGHQLLN